MVYEIWYGDEFINYAYSTCEAMYYAEEGYRVIPTDGYND